MSTHIETVIVGGGQAGLAVSHYLSQKNRPHIVLQGVLLKVVARGRLAELGYPVGGSVWNDMIAFIIGCPGKLANSW